MKTIKKPARRRIVVALLGMCLAVSFYTVSTPEASASQVQAGPSAQSSVVGKSDIVPFWDPFWPFYYGYYYYYYYYYPGFFFYYYY
jgi:hypothetical protein